MAGYHQVLVGWDNANEAAPVLGTNGIGIRVISCRIELDAEVFQSTTDRPSHRGGVFAETASENQEIESAKGGGERADLLSELITEHPHRHLSAHLGILSFEQRFHVRADA